MQSIRFQIDYVSGCAWSMPMFFPTTSFHLSQYADRLLVGRDQWKSFSLGIRGSCLRRIRQSKQSKQVRHEAPESYSSKSASMSSSSRASSRDIATLSGTSSCESPSSSSSRAPPLQILPHPTEFYSHRQVSQSPVK